ncbi:S8 family serine peptidase [Trujillonella humicola]|uniref:S8 family serine peptidase n=1 Tax=Trujillonella humicola TaxID=3383699 RepID=UPI00390658C1
MPTSVQLNDASDRQLAVLLGLDSDQVALVVRLRPVRRRQDLAMLPVTALARIDDLLEIPKLDINEATPRELVEITGIPVATADRVVARRPYFTALELRALSGMDAEAFTAITEFFAPRPLGYVDKLSGGEVRLTPDPSRLLVSLRPSDTESAASVGESHRLTRVSSTRDGRGYQVFAVPETEGATDALDGLKGDERVELVIPSFRRGRNGTVFFDPQFCIAQFRAGTAEARQDEVIAAAGLAVERRHRTPGLVTLRLAGQGMNPAAIMQSIGVLNEASEVEFAEPAFVAVNDLEVAATLEMESGTATGTAADLPWNLRLVGARPDEPATAGHPDVVVAVIDTGVETSHPAIAHAVLSRPSGESWNFEDDDDPEPTDDQGHGTFIAGLLAGRGEGGIWGICPSCSILPLRVGLSGASLSYAQRRDAILYAVGLVRSPRRLVLNLSWKTTGDVALIRDAVVQAEQAGAVVVASAGNWPAAEDEPHFPSDYRQIVSVGAVGPDGRRAAYSFYGREVDLVAPGGRGTGGGADNIRSAARGGRDTVDFGTSFASPHVAGAAALVLSRRRDISVAEVRDAVERSANPLPDSGTGRGLLDVGAGVTRASPSPSGPVAPTAGDGGLVAVNTMDQATLMSSFGLLAFTARLIVARRPFASLEQLRGLLGLTAEQFDRILRYDGGG